MKQIIIMLVHFCAPLLLFSQNDLPQPTADNIVFYIQHNKGKNTFFYQANFENNGELNAEKPLIIKRQLFDNEGEIKPITAIQNRFAYGLKVQKKDTNNFEITLVAYPKQKLSLKTDNENKPFVETTIDGKYIRVERLFIVQDAESSGLNRKINAIEFYGFDQNGKPIKKQLIPEK